MEEKENKMDLVARGVPELPVLSEEQSQMQGTNKLIRDFNLGRIERRELEEKRKILAETRIQLLRDRTREVIAAWRIEAAAAREKIMRAAEEYAQSGIELSKVKMNENKSSALEKAICNYSDAVKNIRPDLPDHLKEKFIEKSMVLLDQTIDEIMNINFDIDKSIEKNYPEKKSFFSQLLK